MKTVFISRNPEDALELSEFCKKHGWELMAHSLIDFKQVNATFPEKTTDVVFFTSPRSVQFFLNQAQLQKNQKIACIGQKTTEFIQKMGFSVDFYAKNDKFPTQAAQEFKSWLNDRTVLFPISNRSNKSMQKVLKNTQYFEVVVYETVLLKHIFNKPFDVYIFSSPSNSEAFLTHNKFYLEPKIFAWGATTQHYLQEQGFQSEIYQSAKSLEQLL